MKTLLRFFAERHLLANVLYVLIVVLGLGSLTVIKRELQPEVDFGWVWVTTRYPGASPEDVELNVTNKLEDAVKSVSGIEQMTSISMENISFLEITIDPDAEDMEEVKQHVRQAVSRVTDLPPDVTESPLIEEPDSLSWPILEIGLSADLPYAQLRQHARQLEQKLKDLPYVAEVNTIGDRAREIRIMVAAESLKMYEMPFTEIIRAIQQRNIRTTTGSFESYALEKSLVTLAQFRDPQEVADVIIRASATNPLVRVSDLAVIEDGFEEERIISHVNGRKAISFRIVKNASADIIRTVDAVKALIREEQRYLPAEVTLTITGDYSRLVRNILEILLKNGAIGLVLVWMLLAVFLNLRAAFWVGLGIPVTMLGVIFLLPAFDVNLDSLSLSAMIIMVGIVVDEAIVICENIYHRYERGDPPIEAAVNGLHEVFMPVLTTVLTTLLAFAPLFFMPGNLGKFIRIIPIVVSLALVISFLKCLMTLPAHIAHGLQPQPGQDSETENHSWFVRVRRHFETVAQYTLKFRYLVVGLAFVFLLAAVWYAVTSMKFIVFPNQGADQIVISADLPIGTPIETTEEAIAALEKIVRRLPDRELDSFVSRIGSQGGGVMAAGESEHKAEISVYLTPYSQRERPAQEIIEDLKTKTRNLSGFEDIRYAVQGIGISEGAPVTLRVVGSDDAMRKRLTDDVAAYLEARQGVFDVERDDLAGKEQIEITFNYAKLAVSGLTVANVANNVRIATDGEIVTRVRYGQEDVDFRILLEKDAQRTLRYLKTLFVPNARGELIRLGEVADFVFSPGPSNYLHYNGERAVTITAQVAQGVVTSGEVVQDVLARFDAEREYGGMRFSYGGAAEQQEESVRGLLRVFAYAVVGIYLLLVLLFNSLLTPVFVMLAIPLGIAGVILIVATHGQPLSFFSLLGIVGLSGVVVNDSLVLVAHVNTLRAQKPDTPVLDLVAEGAADRLRAIILTTVTTVAGLLPLAYGIGGYDMINSPMALALGWGLLLATPITLLLVPALYAIAYDLKRLVTKTAGEQR